MKKIALCLLTFISLSAFAQYNFQLDSTFDSDGKKYYQEGTSSSAIDVAMQSNGKVLMGLTVTYESVTEVAVIRLNDDGSMDPTFGDNGFQLVSIPNSSYSSLIKIEVDSDDKIILGCSIGDIDLQTLYGLVRLMPNGAMDNDFGNGGVVTTAIDPMAFYGGMMGIALQPDGKIISYGTTSNTTNAQFVLFRVDQSGDLDITFSFEGFVYEQATEYNDYPINIFFHNTDIYIAGHAMIPTGGLLDPAYSEVVMMKFHEDGSRDLNFADNGVFVANLDTLSDQITHIVFNDDGTFFAGGNIQDLTPENYDDGVADFLLMKFTSDGQPDLTFASNGYLRYDYDGRNESLSSMFKDAEGDLIVAGTSQFLPFDNNICLFRVNQQGDLDEAFAPSGYLITNLYASYDYIYEAMLLPSGKILTVGISNVNGDVWATAARFVSTSSTLVKEVDLTSAFVYPNPAYSTLNVSAHSAGILSLYEIYNLQGKLVASARVGGNNSIAIGSLPSGVYHIRFMDRDGFVASRQNFIKE
jgi:uncharacterized delta-60 repeat protein